MIISAQEYFERLNRFISNDRNVVLVVVGNEGIGMSYESIRIGNHS